MIGVRKRMKKSACSKYMSCNGDDTKIQESEVAFAVYALRGMSVDGLVVSAQRFYASMQRFCFAFRVKRRKFAGSKDKW